ncbi:MAG: ribosome-recycling factor, partial [Actinomycetota bacterium]
PRSLVISPYDASALGEIERAIQESDLGLTPSNDGKIIRLAIPQLTEERRKELVKVVRQIAEDGRVAVRNVRRDAIADIQSLASEVGADELHRAEEKVQKLTDDHVGQIDAALKQREADIMEV